MQIQLFALDGFRGPVDFMRVASRIDLEISINCSHAWILGVIMKEYHGRSHGDAWQGTVKA